MNLLQGINGSNELKRRIVICRRRVRRARATHKTLTIETERVRSPAPFQAENAGEIFADKNRQGGKGGGSSEHDLTGEGR